RDRAEGAWRSSSRRRKREDKGGALPRHTLHRHAAPMDGQNLPHNIETQAGAPRLGGVERLENPRYLLGGNTDPTIADAQLDLQSGAETFQAQRAPRGHGLDGIL